MKIENVEVWLGYSNISEPVNVVVKDVSVEDNPFSPPGEHLRSYVLHVQDATNPNKKYLVRLNKTNLYYLVREFGDETTAWVDKQLILSRGLIAGKYSGLMITRADKDNPLNGKKKR